MPRIRLLASALALAICSISTAAASTASAPAFDSYVVIGDSLSDAGNLDQALITFEGAPLPPNLSFTTNPDPIAARIIAAHFGLSADPSLNGGTDFAWGSACVGTGPCESAEFAPLPIPTLGQQIDQYLGVNGGNADPNALFSYLGGANDIFGNLGAVQAGLLDPSLVPGNIAADGQLAAAQIGKLQAAGARNIIVFNLPDIGVTPEFHGGPFQSTVSKLVLVFNGQLNAGLAGKTGIIPVDAFGLVNEVLANPTAYGFTNVTTPACTSASPLGSLVCGPAGSGLPNSFAPGTDQTYFFADGVHPTGAAQALLAESVLQEIEAPSFISMLAETPLQTFATTTRGVHDQLQADMTGQRTDGTLRTYASIDYSRQRFDGTTTSPQTTSDDSTLIVGSDYYVNNAISLGLSSTFSHQSATFDGGGGRFQNNEPLISAYGMWHSPDFYVSLLGSVGQLNFTGVNRVIQLGTATRTENGDTSGSHTGVELAGGYFFHWGDIKSGPFASFSAQHVRVGSYNENGNDSTAMVFGRQSRTSTISRIGWELSGDNTMFGGDIHPFARVAFEHEGDANVRDVSAGLVGLNGTFSMPGYQPDSSYWSGELGVAANLGSSFTGYAAYAGHFGDSNERVDSFNLGLKWSW